MPKSRNILAAFRTIEEAQKAGQELRKLGFNELQIDKIGKYPGNHLNDLTNPVTGDFESLADLTLGALTNKNAEVLAAADPSASGMADGSGMEINENVLLTLVTEENQASEAENVIKKFNGKI